ncbi:MAG: DUF4783 domain-containing protein [Melioribacteraceae bacterium]|nr:DUF4783 domain-containing protein [Melioribacteraceae bacterium]
MRILYKIILLLFISQLNFAQVAGEDKSELVQIKFETADTLFNKIKIGLTKGEIEKFNMYLDNKTYISLSNGKMGYYSSNQIYYIFEDFFDSYKPFDFDYSTVRAGSQKPFASGTLKYINNGKHKAAKVFVSLIRILGKWKISQLTIN